MKLRAERRAAARHAKRAARARARQRKLEIAMLAKLLEAGYSNAEIPGVVLGIANPDASDAEIVAMIEEREKQAA